MRRFCFGCIWHKNSAYGVRRGASRGCSWTRGLSCGSHLSTASVGSFSLGESIASAFLSGGCTVYAFAVDSAFGGLYFSTIRGSFWTNSCRMGGRRFC